MPETLHHETIKESRELRTFLILTLSGCESSTSYSDQKTLRGKSPDKHYAVN
jgi:hypothetical protein